MSTTTPTSNFVTKALALANKSEDQIQNEKFTEFAENAIIDIEQKIANIKTGDIPRLEGDLKRAEVRVKKSKENFENAKFTIASSTSAYLQNRESALDAVELGEASIVQIKESISSKKKELALFEEVLTDLK